MKVGGFDQHLYNKKSGHLTKHAKLILKDIFSKYDAKAKEHLNFEDFQRMFHVTNPSVTLSVSAFQTLFPANKVTFGDFCKIYQTAFDEDGYKEGMKALKGDLSKHQVDYSAYINNVHVPTRNKASVAKKKSNNSSSKKKKKSIMKSQLSFFSKKPVGGSKKASEKSTINQNLDSVCAEKSIGNHDYGSILKSSVSDTGKNSAPSPSVPGLGDKYEMPGEQTTSCPNAEKVVSPPTAVKVAPIFMKKNKDSKARSVKVNGNPKKRKVDAIRKTSVKKKDDQLVNSMSTKQKTYESESVSKIKTREKSRRNSLAMATGKRREALLLKTKDFFLSKDEKLEKDQILDKRRRAEIAMKAKETLRKDILKQKKEHNLIYKNKTINPFFQQVKDRTKAAEARQIKKTTEIGTVTNGVNSANSSDNAVAWDLMDFPTKSYVDCIQCTGNHDTENKICKESDKDELFVVPTGKLVDANELLRHDMSSVFLDESTRKCLRNQSKTEFHDFASNTDNQVTNNVAEKCDFDKYAETELDTLADSYNYLCRKVDAPFANHEVVATRKMIDAQFRSLARCNKVTSTDSITSENGAKEIEPTLSCNKSNSSLYTVKYRPGASKDFAGSPHSIGVLLNWLKEFTQKKNEIEAKEDDEEWYWEHDFDDLEERYSLEKNNTMLITGPSGSGKTSAVFACAKQLEYDVIEIHAGQIRSKTKILQLFGEATQSHRLPTKQQQQTDFSRKKESFEPKKKKHKAGKDTGKKTKKKKNKTSSSVIKRSGKYEPSQANKATKSSLSLILFEEVDQMSYFDDDKGFFEALKKLIKTSKRPIILTANKMNSTLEGLGVSSQYFPQMKLSKVVLTTKLISLAERIKVDVSDIIDVSRLYNNDLRKVLMALQMWGGNMDAANGSSVNNGLPLLDMVLGTPLRYLNESLEPIDQRYTKLVENEEDSNKIVLRNRMVSLDKVLNTSIAQDGFALDVYFESGIKYLIRDGHCDTCEIEETHSSESGPAKHLCLLWPMIDGISPDWGDTSGGVQIKIFGRNFIPRGVKKSKWKDHVEIYFGEHRCMEFDIISETEIVCKTPRVTNSTKIIDAYPNNKRKTTKGTPLPVLVQVIVDGPEGRFVSSEHIDGDVRIHNNYLFTYFPPKQGLDSDGDISDGDIDTNNADYVAFMANSAVGMSRGGRKRRATRINWSSVKEKDIVFPDKKLGLSLLQKVVKLSDRNPFSHDSLFVESIQPDCKCADECRVVKGWFLKSLYNPKSQKRISVIDDELGLAEVAKLITQGEMRARPLTITFQNICFSTVEKENDFMLREDVLARSIMVKEMEEARLQEIELMHMEDILATDWQKENIASRGKLENEQQEDASNEKLDGDELIPLLKEGVAKADHSDSGLSEWCDMVDAISCSDLLGKPYRCGETMKHRSICIDLPKTMPSNSSFTCEYPMDWEEVPHVLQYPSNADSLGQNIAATIRSDAMLHLLSKCKVRDVDFDEEDYNSTDCLALSSPVLNKSRANAGNDYIDVLVKSTIPKSQVGIMPGCFQRNVTSYIGFLSKINEIEILNEKGEGSKKRKRRYTHYFDIIGLNINSKTDMYPSRFKRADKNG